MYFGSFGSSPGLVPLVQSVQSKDGSVRSVLFVDVLKLDAL